MSQQDTIRVGVVPSMIGAEGVDPIVVEVPRNTSPNEIQALALSLAKQQHTAERDPARSVGLSMPTGDSLGLQLPAGAMESAAPSIVDASGQLAGLVAGMYPAGRGLKAATAIPMLVDAVMQAVTKGPSNIDIMQSAEHGAFGGGARIVGKGAELTGKVGEGKVLRAFGLEGADKTKVLADNLPRIAIREGAEMSDEGIAALRQNARKTLPSGVKTTDKGMTKLADVMDKQLLTSRTSPNRMTPWIPEAASKFAGRAPRQLKMGRRMAAPFGVDMQSEIAPNLEQLLRLLAAQHMAGGPDEPSMETSRGPVRRSQK